MGRLEQFVRDCRITLIYEGTNGIQALDLVGRKLAANGGRAVFSYFAEIDDFIGSNEGNAELAPFLEGLASAKAQLQEGTTWLMQNGMTDFNNAGAASTDYLQLFGLTALAYMWAQMAKVALEKRGNDPFYDDQDPDRKILCFAGSSGNGVAPGEIENRRRTDDGAAC